MECALLIPGQRLSNQPTESQVLPSEVQVQRQDDGGSDISFLPCLVRARKYAWLMPEDVGVKKLEIKKYANRRYYDATHSRHLTLEEIQTLIQQGYDIKVTDAKTSADITGQVLTQIILELDTPKLDSLPVPLLVRLIRMNDQLVKDFVEKYFNQALKSFFDYQRQVEDQIRKTHGLPAVFPTVSAWTKAMLEPFASAFSSPASQTEHQPTPTASAADSEKADLVDLVQQLQREVANLKQQRPSRKKASPRKHVRATRARKR
jgi:polyhydroxyalkanoate synthesis repressor PhaR